MKTTKQRNKQDSQISVLNNQTIPYFEEKTETF